MKEIKTEIEKMFRIGIDLAEIIIKLIPALKAKDEEELICKYAIWFFFCKAYKTYQAVHLLCKEGYEQDATILNRSIYELGLQARYMMLDPKKNGRSWAEHEEVARYKFYLNNKVWIDKEIQNDIVKQNRLRDLKEFYEQNKARQRNGKWWGNTIRWLAEQIGEPMITWYKSVYGIESNIVHSGIMSVNDYITDNNGALQVDCYPVRPVSWKEPTSATLYFLQVIDPII